MPIYRHVPVRRELLQDLLNVVHVGLLVEHDRAQARRYGELFRGAVQSRE